MGTSGRSPGRRIVAGGLALAALIFSGCRAKPRRVPAVSGPAVTQEAARARKPVTRKITLPHGREIHAPVVKLTRDEAVALGLLQNHGLAASRLGPAVAAEGIEAARADFDPSLASEMAQASSRATAGVASPDLVTADLELARRLRTGASVSFEGDVAQYRDGGERDQGWSLSVTQPLRRGAGRRVNEVGIRLAENTYARSEYSFIDYVITFVQAVESAYLDLLLAREVRAIRDFALNLAREQRDLTLSLIHLGRLAQDARASADAEVALRQADLISAMFAVHKSSISLMELLSPDEYDPLRTSVDTAVPPIASDERVELRASVDRAHEMRPDLAQARLDLERSRLEVVRTRDGLLPRLDAFASYGEPGGFRTGDDDEYVVGFRLSTSLTRRAERSAHRQAAFEIERAREALANLERVVASDVRRKAADAEEKRRRIPATARVVAARQKELEVERERFRVGKSTNLDVLRVQEKLIEARLDATETDIGFLKALTALYAAEGTLLQRRSIRIDYAKGK